MPAAIVIVHDDKPTREAALAALWAAGHQAVAFGDPISALNAVEKDSRVRVLVSRIDFGPGKLNGAALVRMLRHKQLTQGGQSRLRVIFVALPANEEYAREEGDYLPMPLDPQALVDTVGKALAAE